MRTQSCPLFARWRQENFFKYLKEEFALDALVDYDVLPDDPLRSVPNPARRVVDAELRKARTACSKLQAAYGSAALANPEQRRPTMRGFKIAYGKLGQQLRAAMQHVATLDARRAALPERVPVSDLRPDAVVKLATERKLLTNLVKMVAYQAETDLFRGITPHYARAEDDSKKQAEPGSLRNLAGAAGSAPYGAPDKAGLAGNPGTTKANQVFGDFEAKNAQNAKDVLTNPAPSGPNAGKRTIDVKHGQGNPLVLAAETKPTDALRRPRCYRRVAVASPVLLPRGANQGGYDGDESRQGSEDGTDGGRPGPVSIELDRLGRTPRREPVLELHQHVDAHRHRERLDRVSRPARS